MKFEMTLPEMGESVQEATVTRWVKQVGDSIEVDETIVEVATDKVDSEVPSPVSGKIVELKCNENDVAAVGAVICVIESDIVPESTVGTDAPAPETTRDTSNDESPVQSGPAIIPIELPEMGESVQEATITGWFKSVGDTVEADENLLEVATDKVDTEVPSPVSGKIVEILVPVDGVAKIGEAVAMIETEAVSASTPTSQVVDNPKKTSQPTTPTASSAPSSNGKNAPMAGKNSGFYSPLVKRIAKMENIPLEELASVKGTGMKDRLTKSDMLQYVAYRKANGPASATVSASSGGGHFPHHIPPVNVQYDPTRVTVEAMSTMRKGIAKHMVQSMYTAPHVFSIHEVNMKRIWDWRNSVKGAFKKKYGFNLTLTHIIMEQVARAIKVNPRINASIQGDNVIIRHDINLGMAVGYTAKDGDNGLMVPVIHNIDELNLLGIARKATELTDKARMMSIKPDDIAGGTFTVTNVGTFGTEVGLGIINQPQVAILALGTIVKKPVVTKDEAIQIAPMMKMALSYDHRVVDGMLAGTFLAELQKNLEEFEADPNLI